MFSVLVVVGINEIKNLGACIGLIEEASALEHFAFEGAHE